MVTVPQTKGGKRVPNITYKSYFGTVDGPRVGVQLARPGRGAAHNRATSPVDASVAFRGGGVGMVFLGRNKIRTT